MQSFIESLCADARVTVVDSESAWSVRIPKPDFSIEVTIPREVLEWFVSASQSGCEVWSDWMDYYAAAGETDVQLRSDMERDVMWFISQLMALPVRLTSGVLEWQTESGWKEVSLYVEAN